MMHHPRIQELKSHRDCAATDDNADWDQGPEEEVLEEVPAGEEAEPYEGTFPHH